MKPGIEKGSVILENIEESTEAIEALLDFSTGSQIRTTLLLNRIDGQESVVAPIELTFDEGKLLFSAFNNKLEHHTTATNEAEKIQSMIDDYRSYF